MFNSDLFANRPSFGIVGRIFISTDTKEFFRDTGTSWELIGGPGSGTITGSGAATQVAFWNSASTITGSNNLFWDSTNNYLGINTNAPTTALDVHHSTNSGAIFNQTTATNNNTINFQTSGSGRWRIGNFYTAGADDFGIFDVVGSLQQLTILKTTGQTFIGSKTTASGRLVVNSATADAHLQIVGANSPSIRIDNAGSGGTQRFVFGLATATNNFIQGATAGEFCISTQSAGNMLFGMWQTINASEVMRITTSNNLLVGKTTDTGERFQVQGTTLLNGNVQFGSNFIWNNTNVLLTLDNSTNSGSDRGLLVRQTTADGAASLIRMQKSRGGVVTTGTSIGAMDAEGFSGSVYNIAARILYTAQGTISAGVVPGQIGFFTANNSGVLTSRGYINNLGNFYLANNLLVGSETDNGNSFQVTGNGFISGNLGLGAASTSGYKLLVSGDTYLQGTNNYIDGLTIFRSTLAVESMRVKNTGIINMSNVPNSSVGLVSGDIYQTAGVLNIVP
jgi:hypothetical protein